MFQEQRIGAPPEAYKSLSDTLVDAPFAVTVCTPSEIIAQSFLRQRIRPFTRALSNAAWSLQPIPPQTQSVETNFLQIFSWRQDRVKKRLEAFLTALQTPQRSVCLLMLSSHGLRIPQQGSSVESWLVSQKKPYVFQGPKGELHMISLPSAVAHDFVGAWLRRHEQETQEMIDELPVMPLTLQVFQEKLQPREGGGVLERVAHDLGLLVEFQTLSDGGANSLMSLAAQRSTALQESQSILAASLVPASTGPTVGAWVFFGVVCAVLLIGVGFASSQRLRQDNFTSLVTWKL